MQGLQRHTDALSRAVVQPELTVEKERIAGPQVHAAFLEAHDADLRALQVTQQADIAATFLGSLSQAARPLAMFVRTAVREVQARDVETGHDHLAQCFSSLRRRAQRRDNLGSSPHARDYCTALAEE